jgi:HEAT repeat protein
LIEIMGKYKVTEAAKAILPFEKDPDPNVRRAVLTALANIADPVGEPVLRAALLNPDTDASARAAAAATLGAFGTTEANDAMVKTLSDFDLAVADAASAGLARAAVTNEATATVAISRALTSPDPAVRTRAASATSGMTQTGLAAKALTDTDAGVRVAAATAIGDILVRRGGNATPAELAPLVKALGDANGTVSDTAQQSLVRVGANSVPALTPLLAVSEDATAYYAVRTLAAIGNPAYDAVAAAAQSGKPSARWAAVTLGELGDPRAKPILESLQSSPDANTSQAAKDALSKISG